MLTTRLLSQGYQKTKLVATLKNLWEISWSDQSLQCGSMGDIMIWSIFTMWQFPESFLMFLPMTIHKSTSKIPDVRFYLHFLRSGLWAWWAKLAYQVMLTIRGRLFTPFILGFMSVGLTILIRYSFMNLWVWITAWVPCLPLLSYCWTHVPNATYQALGPLAFSFEEGFKGFLLYFKGFLL